MGTRCGGFFRKPVVWLVTFSAIIMAYFLPAQACDYSSWQYSKNYVLNTTSSGAYCTRTHTNFPVCLRLNAANFGGFGQCLANGADLRIAQDTSDLSFEIEKWDAANSVAVIWVTIPVMYPNNGTQHFTVYWGKSGVSGVSNSSAVFATSSGYAAVYHLKESSGSLNDATSNRYTGTRNGSMSSLPAVIDNGQSLNGTTDYASMGNVLNPGSSPLMISAWVKRGETNRINTIISKSNGDTPSSGYGWLFAIDEGNYVKMYLANGGTNWGDAGSFSVRSAAQFTDLTTWHHVAVVIDRSSTGSCKIYIDGVDQTGSTTGNVTTVGSLSNSLNMVMGSEADGNYKFKGGLDQVMVATTTHSDSWVKLCYDNQKPNQTLISAPTMSTIVLTNDGRGTTRVVSGTTQGLGTISATIQAENYPGFKFVRWNVYGQIDSATFGNATQATTTVTVKNAAVTVLAIFEDVTSGATGGAVGYPNTTGPGDNMIVDGSVTVATTNTDKTLETMTVNGRVKCDGLKVQNWLFSQKAPPDYVFDAKYSLPDLNTVEAYVKANGHLPEMPSAKEMQKSGIELAEFNMLLLKKIEELTLYTIEMKKELATLKGKK